MPNYLLHLWATPPEALVLTPCPAPPPGTEGDPAGLFAPESVETAFRLAGYSSLAAAVLVVAIVYLVTSGSLSPRFVRRWWFGLGAAAALSFVIPLLVLSTSGTHALPGSCSTNPTAFLHPLPWSIVMERALAGLVWGFLAFTLLSVVFTRTLGYWPGSKGFFHFRGCPVPRIRP